VLERSDQIAEWIETCEGENEFSRQVDAKIDRGRPESGCARPRLRDLGVEEPEARRAVKIASISPEAAEAAREAGIDDNQSKLLKVGGRGRRSSKFEAVYKLAGGRAPSWASRIEPDDSLDFFATPAVVDGGALMGAGVPASRHRPVRRLLGSPPPAKGT